MTLLWLIDRQNCIIQERMFQFSTSWAEMEENAD